MSSRALGRWMKLMAAIAAVASPVAGACGGQVEGSDAAAGGPDLGGPLGSSGRSSSSSGASGTSGSSMCGGARTDEVAYEPPRCQAIVDDAGDADGGPDGGPPSTVVCETERELCERLCDRPLWNGYPGHVTLTSCTIVGDGSSKRVTCRGTMPPCGRAHEGLAEAKLSEGATAVARWLENAAYLEDASVTSFELLAKELEAHGAPSGLVRRAKKSARDEVRHARVMSALAQRHGGRPPRAVKARRSPRGLEAMLRENAVEGCVSETYGAQLAWYQAMHAADPKVKAAMARIAEDETSHAALAWAIAEWGEARLDERTRASIAGARADAWRELHGSLAAEPESDLAATIGLPTATVAQTMLRRLAGDLPPRSAGAPKAQSPGRSEGNWGEAHARSA